MLLPHKSCLIRFQIIYTNSLIKSSEAIDDLHRLCQDQPVSGPVGARMTRTIRSGDHQNGVMLFIHEPPPPPQLNSASTWTFKFSFFTHDLASTGLQEGSVKQLYNRRKRQTRKPEPPRRPTRRTRSTPYTHGRIATFASHRNLRTEFTRGL